MKQMNFKEQYRDFQYLCKEIYLLRKYDDDPKRIGEPFLFAEAGNTITALERFLRIIPKMKASKEDTLSDLLNRAFSKKNQIFQPPKFVIPLTTNRVKEIILQIRNGYLHGNFEQLASYYNCSKDTYFKKHFSQDIQTMFETLECFINQVDIETGKIK